MWNRLVLLNCCIVVVATHRFQYGGNGVAPRPIITLHEGHIGLYDQLLTTEFTGQIVPGQPYTLDIYMGNTDRYDYVIQKCSYNTEFSFLDNYGCLRRDNVFQDKWETNEYTIPGAMKRTLVHFTANDRVVRFDCLIKVVECCGCAEMSCERQPPITYYPTYDVPLMCSYPVPGVPPAIPIGGGTGGSLNGGYWQNEHAGFWAGIPWWLWLLLLLLLLLLLALLVCAVCCCLMSKRKSRARQTETKTRRPSPPPPPPIAPKPQQIVQEQRTEGVQTVPETKQAGQQVNMDKRKKTTTAVPLTVDTGHQRYASNHDAISLVDSYPGTLDKQQQKTIVHTIYQHQGGRHREHNRDEMYINVEQPVSEQRTRSEVQHERYRRREVERRQRQHGGVPVLLGASEQQQQQLQEEIEQHMRRERQRHELEERIENHLSEHREHREHRNHYSEQHRFEASPVEETLREETVRTMRQSSVI